LLMLNEHFIDYQACVRDQVEQQLQYVAMSSESLQSESLQSAPLPSASVAAAR